MGFTPSHYQKSILQWVRTGTGNGIIVAVAGSGKTTTLVEAAKEIDCPGLFLAFNAHIADELGQRLAGTRMTALTIHKVGNRVLSQAIGKATKPNMGYTKWKEIGDEAAMRLGATPLTGYSTRVKLLDLISKVMVTLTNPKDIDAVAGLVDHFNMDIPENEIARYAAQVAPCINQGLEIAQNTGAINFDEMIYLPVVLDLSPPKFRWVFVDEAQDLNACQRTLAINTMAEDGRILFVGDDRQAIYGFAGADAASFYSIAREVDAIELPLSINYRCPKSHIELVKDIVPHIEAWEQSTEGEIIKDDEHTLPSHATPGSMVICRTTAPLVGACIELIRLRRKARVLGRDIGKGLMSVLDKVLNGKPFKPGEIIRDLESYKVAQSAKLALKEGNESKIQALHDQVDTLAVCIQEFGIRTYDGLRTEIENLFADPKEGEVYNGVTFSTVHKAKGLEADVVIILKPEKLPLVWENQQEWQYVQELNLRYVALTRARKVLVLLGSLSGFVMASPVEDNTVDGTSEDVAPEGAPALPEATPVQEDAPAQLALPVPPAEDAPTGLDAHTDIPMELEDAYNTVKRFIKDCPVDDLKTMQGELIELVGMLNNRINDARKQEGFRRLGGRYR